jgi:ribosomal protein S1
MIVSEPLRIGAVVEGVVTRITNFGAFVDLGGIDGLLHISQIAWPKIAHPGEVLTVGQRLKVVVLKYYPSRNRVSLGRKQLVSPNNELQSDPLKKPIPKKLWDKIHAKQDAKLSKTKRSSKKLDKFERVSLIAKRVKIIPGGLPSLGKKK